MGRTDIVHEAEKEMDLFFNAIAARREIGVAVWQTKNERDQRGQQRFDENS